MHRCMMIVGLIRTFVGHDYRSQGQRRELRRLGREFVRENFDFVQATSSPDGDRETLTNHPNAVRP